MTPAEAAACIGITPGAVHAAIRRRRMKAVLTLEKRKMVTPFEVEHYSVFHARPRRSGAASRRHHPDQLPLPFPDDPVAAPAP